MKTLFCPHYLIATEKLEPAEKVMLICLEWVSTVELLDSATGILDEKVTRAVLDALKHKGLAKQLKNGLWVGDIYGLRWPKRSRKWYRYGVY